MSLSSAVAMIVVAFIVAPYILNPNRSAASTFLWSQGSWVGNGTGAQANYPGNNSNFTDYTSKTNIDVSSGKVTMATPQIASTGDSTYTAQSGFYVKNGVLKLLKPDGASCGTAGDGIGDGECMTGKVCNASNVCETPCGQLVVVDPRDTNNPNYNTVLLAGKCWMARNLNVGTMLATGGTPVTSYNVASPQKWCPMPTGTGAAAAINVANCNDGAGGFYTWAQAHGLASSCDTNGCTVAAGTQGLCPSGWHVATASEWTSLMSTYSTPTLLNNAGFNFFYAGFRLSTGSFQDRGVKGMFWYNTEAPPSSGYYKYIVSGGIGDNYINKLQAMSVRCVKN